MTDPLFLTDLPDPLPAVGEVVTLGGSEGHHAAVVRRLRTGEPLLLGDGHGRGVRGEVTSVNRIGLTVTVTGHLSTLEPALRFVVAQALAKGDRAELALEVLTEVGASEMLPWAAERCVVRWTGDRADKGLTRWRATVREAAKQSRRLRVPEIGQPRRDLRADVVAADLAVVLHELAATPLREVALPAAGTVLVIVGPEGGITPGELDALTTAGAVAAHLGDGVLRTSTAGVVALAALLLR